MDIALPIHAVRRASHYHSMVSCTRAKSRTRGGVSFGPVLLEGVRRTARCGASRAALLRKPCPGCTSPERGTRLLTLIQERLAQGPQADPAHAWLRPTLPGASAVQDVRPNAES